MNESNNKVPSANIEVSSDCKERPFPALHGSGDTDALDARRKAADAVLESRMLSVLAVPENDRLPFLIWESVDLCDKEHCAAGKTCKAYVQAGKYDGKCPIQHKYVRSVADVVFSSISAKASALTLLEIGMHIIPLYNQLAKLKIIEASLGGQLMVMTPKGPILHPVAREIRACIMTINAITKEVVTRRDLNTMARDLRHITDTQGDEQEGSNSYYAELKKHSMYAKGSYSQLASDSEKVLNLEEPPAGIATPRENGHVGKNGKYEISNYMKGHLVDKAALTELKNFSAEMAQISDEESAQPAIEPELLPPSSARLPIPGYRRRKPKES
jgi:hypothetical protein